MIDVLGLPIPEWLVVLYVLLLAVWIEVNGRKIKGLNESLWWIRRDWKEQKQYIENDLKFYSDQHDRLTQKCKELERKISIYEACDKEKALDELPYEAILQIAQIEDRVAKLERYSH